MGFTHTDIVMFVAHPLTEKKQPANPLSENQTLLSAYKGKFSVFVLHLLQQRYIDFQNIIQIAFQICTTSSLLTTYSRVGIEIKVPTKVSFF